VRAAADAHDEVDGDGDAEPDQADRTQRARGTSPTKYASTPIVVAHEIPPSAFQKRKRRHRIRLAPASQEVTTRIPGSQRPKKTSADTITLRRAALMFEHPRSWNAMSNSASVVVGE
jgi:hypothetical protein